MIHPKTYFPSRFFLCTGLFLMLFILATAHLGYAQTCTPGSGVTVMLHPADNVQSIVNSTVCGSTFVFTPGVYSNVTIFPANETTNPIDGDTFKGQFSRTTSSAATLYGATVVANFTQQGSYWVGNVTTTPAPASGSFYRCDSNHPGCLLPEDLFFDGKMYLRVTSQAAVGAGSWYLDYSTGKVYLTDNPTAHKIEISTTHFAIYGANVANVTILNLIVDKYAAPGGFGGRADRLALSREVPVRADDMILVSVDDHICEPATMFDAHVPDRHACGGGDSGGAFRNRGRGRGRHRFPTGHV